MGRYVALAPVFVKATGRTHMPGHSFEMDADRAAALPPGAAEPAPGGHRAPEPALDGLRAPGPAPTPDAGGRAPREGADGPAGVEEVYESMTNAQLGDVARSRGLSVPKKANKAQLVALLMRG